MVDAPPPRIPKLGHVCPRRQIRITRVASLGVYHTATADRTWLFVKILIRSSLWKRYGLVRRYVGRLVRLVVDMITPDLESAQRRMVVTMNRTLTSVNGAVAHVWWMGTALCPNRLASARQQSG